MTAHSQRHASSTAGQQLAKINMYGFGGFFPWLENCSKYYFIEKKCKLASFSLQKNNYSFLFLSVRKRFVVYCFFAGFENCSFEIMKLSHLFHSFVGLAIHASSQKWTSCRVCRKRSFTKWPFGKMSVGKSVSVWVFFLKLMHFSVCSFVTLCQGWTTGSRVAGEFLFWWPSRVMIIKIKSTSWILINHPC